MPSKHGNKTYQCERSTGSGGVYSMILSIWNIEYALQLQSIQTLCFRYVRRHPMRLLMFFAISKSILSVRTVKMLISLHVFIGLSSVWNH